MPVNRNSDSNWGHPLGRCSLVLRQPRKRGVPHRQSTREHRQALVSTCFEQALLEYGRARLGQGCVIILRETILLCGNFEGCPIRLGSMGKPAPGVPLHIINNDGTEAAAGDEGDMTVLLINQIGQQKRWYLTGDKAKRDGDRYFWFVGRADEVINSSGYRIGPFEVESALQGHSEVEESAVVSSPDPVRGEVIKAFVVLKEASTQDHKF
ncbi:hypothetical protein BKA61DRAFT_579751 [Leptodontidium sp. MPI-SDFR-AT-0119]|nr:hypothetical protein BKA61DRAFT_579751 [Leptodontidium sp. MPI-SDFR-AT-0119]